MQSLLRLDHKTNESIPSPEQKSSMTSIYSTSACSQRPCSSKLCRRIAQKPLRILHGLPEPQNASEVDTKRARSTPEMNGQAPFRLGNMSSSSTDSSDVPQYRAQQSPLASRRPEPVPSAPPQGMHGGKTGAYFPLGYKDGFSQWVRMASMYYAFHGACLHSVIHGPHLKGPVMKSFVAFMSMSSQCVHCDLTIVGQCAGRQGRTRRAFAYPVSTQSPDAETYRHRAADGNADRCILFERSQGRPTSRDNGLPERSARAAAMAFQPGAIEWQGSRAERIFC